MNIDDNGGNNGDDITGRRTLETYRGFDVINEDGAWIAEAWNTDGELSMRLGPFDDPGAARFAVDVALDV